MFSKHLLAAVWAHEGDGGEGKKVGSGYSVQAAKGLEVAGFWTYLIVGADSTCWIRWGCESERRV